MQRLCLCVLLCASSVRQAGGQLGHGRPVAAAAPGARAASGPPDCALLVFRHVQKTGGSTLRNFFRQQEATGDWEFYSPQGDRNWPEASNRKRLELLLQFWEALESGTTNFTRTPRRLILEWHAEAHLLPPWERAVEVVAWLRRAARLRGCPVMLLTLVRQPVDLYASWYKYEGLRMTKGQALLQWVADNPNLQAATLMAGVSRPAALPFAIRVHEGRSDRMAVWDPRDAAALRLLLLQFDVVAPMERFDEALALVCEAMGFSSPGYIRLNEGARRDMWSMYKDSLSDADLQRMSAYGRGWDPRADNELVHSVDAAASVDLRLYAQAVHRFSKQVAAAGVLYAQALRTLSDNSTDGWRGERPVQRYEWRSAPHPLPAAMRMLPFTASNATGARWWSFVRREPQSSK